MKPLSVAMLEETGGLIKGKPYLASGIYFSGEEEKKYKERQRKRMVRSYSTVLQRYLDSEEGRATIRLFRQVWEVPDRARGSDYTLGWSRWRVFLYQAGWHNSDSQEVIWFGGNGLERYFREGGSSKFQTAPITAHELVTRMSTDTRGRNRDEVEIWRPEQIVAFIRLNAMDLVRFLNR